MINFDLSTRRLLLLVVGGAVIVGALLIGIIAPGHASKALLLACFGLFLGARAEMGWWAWFASTFTQGVALGETGVSLNMLGVVALVAACVGESICNPRWLSHLRNLTNPGGGLLLIATAYWGWSALWGAQLRTDVALDSLRHLLINCFAAVIGAVIFTSSGKRGLLRFAAGVCLLTGSVGLLGVAEYLTKTDLLIGGVDTAGGLFRINGVAPNPIVYGFHLAWSIPFFYLLVTQAERPIPSLLIIAALGATLLAGLLTLNRQTAVLMALISGGAFLLMRGGHLRYLMALAVVGVLVTSPVLAPKIINRFALLGDLHYDTSFKYRRDNFRVGMEIMRRHPTFGLGLGQYPYNWRGYMPDNLFYMHYDDPHRQFYHDLGYSQVATETGIVGLVFFVLLFLIGIIRPVALLLQKRANAPPPDLRPPSFAFYQNYCWMTLLLIASLATASLIQDTLLRPRLWIAWALAASLPLALSNEDEGHNASNY